MKELTVTYTVEFTEIAKVSDEDFDSTKTDVYFDKEKAEDVLKNQFKKLGVYDDVIVKDYKVFVQDVKEESDAC